MRLVHNCPQCGKQLIEQSSVALDSISQRMVTYTCGHTYLRHKDERIGLRETYSVTRDKELREYQKDGVQFILDSGFNCVIGDQMRLGKTPQALMALRNAYTDKKCVLILVRSANKWQWIREYKTWTDSLPLGIYPIEGTKSFIPPGFHTYIVSMDTFSRPGMCKNCKCSASLHDNGPCRGKKGKCGCRLLNEQDSMVQRLLEFPFDLCIVDEAHSFKNTESKRSKALVQFLHEISKETITHVIPFTCPQCKHVWDKTVQVQNTLRSSTTGFSDTCPNCFASVRVSSFKEKIKKDRKCGVIMLTGTPIKNRANEYFVPLNIVAPERFPSMENFKRSYLNDDGTRIHPYKLEQFKTAIASYVLRREKEDVFTDLPSLDRQFTMIEIQNEELKKLYNAQLDIMEANSAKNGGFNYFSDIGELATLRKICGLAKIDFTVEYIDEALNNSDNAKYAIGIHHKGVRDNLRFALKEYGVMTLSGEDSAERKDHVMTSFETGHERILVLNMLAGGVGMDFHYIDNALILERMWSSADEEQFEFRFYNPDKKIKHRNTSIEYVVAKNTIDEFFYDMVEDKRRIFGETISNHWSIEQDGGSFKALMERTLNSRL